jgi:hypothetical protein
VLEEYARSNGTASGQPPDSVQAQRDVPLGLQGRSVQGASDRSQLSEPALGRSCLAASDLQGHKDELLRTRAELEVARMDLAKTRAERDKAINDMRTEAEKVARAEMELCDARVTYEKALAAKAGKLETAEAELQHCKSQVESLHRQVHEVQVALQNKDSELQRFKTGLLAKAQDAVAIQDVRAKLYRTSELLLQLSGLDSQITTESWLQTPECAQQLLIQFAMKSTFYRASFLNCSPS